MVQWSAGVDTSTRNGLMEVDCEPGAGEEPNFSQLENRDIVAKSPAKNNAGIYEFLYSALYSL